MVTVMNKLDQLSVGVNIG